MGFFKRFVVAAICLLPLTSCSLKDECLLVDLFVPNNFYVPNVFDGGKTDFLSWWEGFADEKLKRLFDLAIIKNHDLNLARERLREVCFRYGMNEKEADDQLVKANIEFFPPHTAPPESSKVSQARISGLAGNAIPKDTVDKDSFHFRVFSANFEIDLFGKQKKALAAAKNEIVAVGELGKDVIGLIRSQLTKHYITLRMHQTRKSSMEEYFMRHLEFLTKMKNRIEAGLNSDIELMNVRDQVTWLKDSIYAAEAGANVAVHAIATLIGANDVELVKELLGENPGVPSVDPNILAGTPVEMIKNRPDIRQKLQIFKQFCALMGLSLAEQFPKIYINLTLDLASKTLAGLFNPGATEYSYGISPEQNWYERWKIQSKIRVFQAKLHQAELEYKKTVGVALAEVGDTMALLLRAVQDLNSCNELAAQTKIACHTTQKKLDEQGRSLPHAVNVYFKSALLDHERIGREANQSLLTVDLARTLGW